MPAATLAKVVRAVLGEVLGNRGRAALTRWAHHRYAPRLLRAPFGQFYQKATNVLSQWKQ